jgi:DNA repair photolyase
MFRPIYEPRTRAKEYSDLAINIYTGCNHGCWYCYAKKMHDRWKPNEDFADVKPREGIVEATKRQLAGGKYKGKKIMLCFTCDPYPAHIDTTPTREVIMAIKNAGANVQILTKGGNRAKRDFDLLDSGDSFGITLSCMADYLAEFNEPLGALPRERIKTLQDVSKLGVSTWVSFEPIVNGSDIIQLIEKIPKLVSKDTLLKIGKMNHHKSTINWKEFGIYAEKICQKNDWNYYIKEDLREEMNRHG